MVKNQIKLNMLSSAFITLGLIYAVYEATKYSFLAKLFPFYLSLFLLVLSIINLLNVVAKTFSTKSNIVDSSDQETEGEMSLSMNWAQMSHILGYIIIMYIGIWIIGYPISITLFIVLFYRYLAQASWRSSIIAGLFGFAFLALASKLLNIDWPIGVITFPWPIG
jgi:beta-lactamase regulating signal transducer with metallopeptidase domain